MGGREEVVGVGGKSGVVLEESVCVFSWKSVCVRGEGGGFAGAKWGAGVKKALGMPRKRDGDGRRARAERGLNETGDSMKAKKEIGGKWLRS